MAVFRDTANGTQAFLYGEEHRGGKALAGCEDAGSSSFDHRLNLEGITCGGFENRDIEIVPAAMGGEKPAA